MRRSVWVRCLARRRAERWQSAPASDSKKPQQQAQAPPAAEAEKSKEPEKNAEPTSSPVKDTEPTTSVAATSPAEKEAAKSGDKPSPGLLSSVLASMMKTDVRAAYECSLLPAEQQKEFLQHVRDMETTERKSELEKLKETGKSEIEVAKLKGQAALEEIKQRRVLEEEAEQANHVRQIDLLEKQIAGDVAMVKSKYQFQKWKAVAEREKRMRLKTEELSKRKEHTLLLERLQKEHEAKKLSNEEALRIEAVRHKQALELEGAKASAAKERLNENTAAIKMGPNAAIESVREEERQREEKAREEREVQRQHEWELHTARLQEAEQRALEAARLGTATTRSEMIWRAAQIILASLAIMGAYDWEMKKLADKQATRDHETATRQETEAAEKSKLEASLLAEKERRDSEQAAADRLATFSHTANIELEEAKKLTLNLEIEKARALKEFTEANEKGSQAEAKKKKVELELAEAQLAASKVGLERMENVRRYLFVLAAGGVFTTMLLLGRGNQE
eukprot:TRINITY_DN15797_c0_g1_i3.p1 TRINITY_DN15797_c0_g1~~TRINITY_DN15797_c0_g1_i3.p1  ORF type:complete len:509 (+),score=247.65 TRINITY_DN15797_c0_g1_i3:43-1569(+)